MYHNIHPQRKPNNPTPAPTATPLPFNVQKTKSRILGLFGHEKSSLPIPQDATMNPIPTEVAITACRVRISRMFFLQIGHCDRKQC